MTEEPLAPVPPMSSNSREIPADVNQKAADVFADIKVRCETSAEAIHLIARALMEQAPRWIPVTERMPEAVGVCTYGGYVLVTNNLHVGVGKLTDFEDGELPVFCMEEGETISPPVTHWQPLPPAPVPTTDK